ncbi:hypothetical protein CHH79_05040 [Bacillus siamensis]|uniref:hypothetical protein n=1 Tax=Bacillus TaxID=1386 RepID=UPI0007EAA0DE|nr:hypothetical protein [Bacillus siamensis]MEC3654307.1 hypothetical protein [Bacillus siamensis]MED0772364.1 hypothetical protein [Bacillus siamensis]MED0776501.1 hypothetical protein [Bacillus siamensis]MED0778118.1 hypothetical protein [Bacillus siamensis]MED0834975.1 hypothetical protein [Bacillus siamensis]
MNISLDPLIAERVPGIKAAAVLYEQIEVGPAPQMLKGRLRLFQESLYFDYADGGIDEQPFVKEWARMMEQLSPSFSGQKTPMELMLGDISRERFIESVNSAHDTILFFSLKYSLPIMAYDAAQMDEPISITIGEKEHVLAFSDSGGIFGGLTGQINTRPVTTGTKNMLQLIFFPPSIHADAADELLTSLTKMFEQIHGGTHTVSWLS